MKLEIVFSCLLAVAPLAIPAGAAAQASGGMAPPPNKASTTATIKGTVQNVDPNANTIQVKATAADLKNLQPGQKVMLSMATPGQWGTVVQVSGNLIAISMADASGLQNGEPIALTPASPGNNTQGLNSAPGSSQSGVSTGAYSSPAASNSYPGNPSASGNSVTGITSLTISSANQGTGVMTLRGADRQTLANLKPGERVSLSPLPSSTTIGRAAAQGVNQWMATVANVDPTAGSIRVIVAEPEAFASLKTGQTINFSWSGSPASAGEQGLGSNRSGTR